MTIEEFKEYEDCKSMSELKLKLAIKYGLDLSDDNSFYIWAKNTLGEVHNKMVELYKNKDQYSDYFGAFAELRSFGEKQFYLCRKLARSLNIAMEQYKELLEINYGKEGLKEIEWQLKVIGDKNEEFKKVFNTAEIDTKLPFPKYEAQVNYVDIYDTARQMKENKNGQATQ